MNDCNNNASQNSSCCDSKPKCCSKKIRWKCAFMAGIIATVAISITMYLCGTNTMRFLGQLIAGKEATIPVQYFLGGLVHFTIGVLYAFFYAIFIARMACLCSISKALLMAILLTVLGWVEVPYVVQWVNNCHSSPSMMEKPSVQAAPVESTGEVQVAQTVEKPLSVSQKVREAQTNTMGIMLSFFHHLIYSLVLVMLYCMGGSKSSMCKPKEECCDKDDTCKKSSCC